MYDVIMHIRYFLRLALPSEGQCCSVRLVAVGLVSLHSWWYVPCIATSIRLLCAAVYCSHKVCYYVIPELHYMEGLLALPPSPPTPLSGQTAPPSTSPSPNMTMCQSGVRAPSPLTSASGSTLAPRVSPSSSTLPEPFCSTMCV